MEDQENFSFIKEKIKEKPLNKKRVVKHGLFTLALAVLFGLVSCFVFVCMYPAMDNWMHPKEDTSILIPEDSEEVAETEMINQQEEEKESETTEAVTPIVKELELSDYQLLQNKMYAIGKEANRSIVTVTGVTSDTDWYNNAYESEGQASGIIIGDNGQELLVLTEHKVILGTEEISVTFIDNTTVNATLKKYDGNTGLAILAIDLSLVSEETKNAISYAVLGNSLSVNQGNLVIAIGSPLGTNYSILTGNVTSVNNEIDTIDHTYTIFTTDIVGSSHSSGALLNLNGEIVGLVMQDYSTVGAENTLTALSISELKKLIEALSNGKDIAYLGLKVCSVTDGIAEKYDIPKGIYIKSVSLDSPALEAGLQSGDVIVEMGGDSVSTVEAYESKVLELAPGDTIQIAVKRQGINDYSRVTCNVTAGQLP